MKQTRQFEIFTDKQKNIYLNDLPYFGWNIDNVQKVDNTKMSVERNFLVRDKITTTDNYYWTITVSRDANMANINELDLLFRKYMLLGHDLDKVNEGRKKASSIKFRIFFFIAFLTSITIPLLFNIYKIFLGGFRVFYLLTLIIPAILIVAFTFLIIRQLSKLKKIRKEIKENEIAHEQSPKRNDILEEAYKLLNKQD